MIARKSHTINMHYFPQDSSIQRAFYKRFIFKNVRIYLRRPYVFMTEQFLHGANVLLVFEQMCGKAVPKSVAIPVFVDLGVSHRITSGLLDCRLGRVMATRLSVFTRRNNFGLRKNVLPFPFLAGVRIFTV